MSKKNFSVKEVCEFFWKIEKKFVLLDDKELQREWLPFRFKFYYYLTEKIGLFEKAHPLDLSLLDKVNFAQKSFFNFFWKTPYLSKASENVLVPLPRKIQGVDLYSEKIVSEVEDLTIIDTRLQGGVLNEAKSFDFYYVVCSIITIILAKLLSPFSLRNKLLDKAFDRFSEEFGLNKKDIVALYRKTMFRFHALEWLYSLYFRMKKPKTLYIVGAYFRMDVISAAKKHGIKVVELQHGTITPYHLGYSYPDKQKVIYFPDELWCFGDFWHENTPMPARTQFKLVGAPFIEKLKGYQKAESEKENAVVINSQGVLGTELFKFSVEVARKTPELKVIFRLHPSEKEEKYHKMLSMEADQPSNFEISHRNPNIFELMSSVKYVSGVFSTTIFEAMYLGAKIILIEGVGLEYMEPVIARGEAEVVKTPEEFAQKYKSAISSDASYYYID